MPRLLPMRSQIPSSPLLVGGKSWLVRRKKLQRRIADKMHYSRTGGATMRMPPANFSSLGLARLFGAANPDGEPQPPPHAARSKTAIIVGAVCGVVGLALLVALGGYAASRWRKARIRPEPEQPPQTRTPPESEQPPHEIAGKDLGGDVREGAVEQVELHA